MYGAARPSSNENVQFSLAGAAPWRYFPNCPAPGFTDANGRTIPTYGSPTVKVLGAEIVNFYKTQPWPDGLVFDYGDGIEIEDESGVLLKMDEKYDLDEFNSLYLETGDPNRVLAAWGATLNFAEGSVSFAAAFRVWRKAQTTRTLIVDVPLEIVDAFKAWAAEHKCKVHT